jgi:hypothetical protein
VTPVELSPQEVLAAAVGSAQERTQAVTAGSRSAPAPQSDQAKVEQLRKLDVPGNPVTDQELALRLDALREAHGIPVS